MCTPLTPVCPNQYVLTSSTASLSNTCPVVLSNKPIIISTYLNALKPGQISLDNFDGLLNTSRRLSGIYGEK